MNILFKAVTGRKNKNILYKVGKATFKKIKYNIIANQEGVWERQRKIM